MGSRRLCGAILIDEGGFLHPFPLDLSVQPPRVILRPAGSRGFVKRFIRLEILSEHGQVLYQLDELVPAPRREE